MPQAAFRVLCLAGVAAIVACADELVVPQGGAPLSARTPRFSISVSITADSLAVGDSTLAAATVLDRRGKVVIGRTIDWASTDTSVATVSMLGLVRARRVGRAFIRGSTAGVSDQVALTVVAAAPIDSAPTDSLPTDSLPTDTLPPSSTGEPQFMLGDRQHYSESFEPYASAAALPYAKTERYGTLVVDQEAASAGSRSLRIDWQNAGCLGSTDANVAIDKKVADTTSTDRNWFLRYHARFSPGYQFYWVSGLCSRGVGSKEVVIFRNSNNTGGRITWSAITPQATCPNILGNLPGLLWHFSIDPEPGTTAPSQCSGSLSYRQHLAVLTKGPAALADGAWHRITLHLRRETAPGAGNGLIRVWIDGTLIMDYDGENAASPSHNQVFTRTMPLFNPIQYQSTFNAGAPQAQSRWFDDFLVWSRR
jgi:hypothetical protein